MARYIVNTSRFRPMEFQEMLQPVLAAEEAHVGVETQLGELREKAGVWENMANQQTDPEAYNLYKTYADDLRSQVDSFAAEGLTPSTRSGLQSMRERYSREITPIETAYQRRAQDIAQQREIEMKDPTARHTRLAAATSLDDYLRDPSLSYRSISGGQLAAQVNQAASSLSKQIRDNPQRYKPILGGQQYEAIIEHGFRPEEVYAAIRGDERSHPLLRQMVDDVLYSAGISDFDEATQYEVRVLASQGLYGAIGEDKITTTPNKEWDIAAQMRLIDYKNRLSQEDDPPSRPRSIARPIPVTQADKGFVKDYGGEKLQRAIDTFIELKTTNPYGITDQDISSMRERRSNLPEDQKSWAPRRGTAGVPDPERDASRPGRTEKEKQLIEIADAMNLYGVDNLDDLQIALDYSSVMTAKVGRNYALELTDTGLAIDATKHAINANIASNGEPLRKVTRRGVEGKAVKKDKALEMFSDNKVKTIMYDTTLDAMTLVYEGEKFIIDPLVFGDSFKADIDKLKAVNPNEVSRENEDGSLKPFPQYIRELEITSNTYDRILKEEEGSFFDKWHQYFNDFPKRQGLTGN